MHVRLIVAATTEEYLDWIQANVLLRLPPGCPWKWNAKTLEVQAQDARYICVLKPADLRAWHGVETVIFVGSVFARPDYNELQLMAGRAVRA